MCSDELAAYKLAQEPVPGGFGLFIKTIARYAELTRFVAAELAQ